MTKIREFAEKCKEIPYHALGCYDFKKDTIYLYSPETLYNLVKSHEKIHAEHYKKYPLLKFVWNLADYWVLVGLIGTAGALMFFSNWLDVLLLHYFALVPILLLMFLTGVVAFEELKTSEKSHSEVFKGYLSTLGEDKQ